MLLDTVAGQWKKFECYNFPVASENDYYGNVQRHFQWLRYKYLDCNYIKDTGIDYKGLFVDG